MKEEKKYDVKMSKTEKALLLTKKSILEKPVLTMTTEELKFLAQMETIDMLAGIQTTLNDLNNK